MTWSFLASIAPSYNWQFSPSTNGEFFRLTHTRSDLPETFFYGWIAQANDEESEFYEITTLQGRDEPTILRLPKPAVWATQRIAIRRPRIDLPATNKPYNWRVVIEVSDITSQIQPDIIYV